MLGTGQIDDRCIWQRHIIQLRLATSIRANNTTPPAESVVTRIDEITLQKKYGKRKASKTLFSPLDASDSLRL